MLHIDVLCHAALYIVRYIRDVANQIVIYVCFDYKATTQLRKFAIRLA